MLSNSTSLLKVRNSQRTIMTNLLKPSYFKEISGHKIAFYESPGKGETVLLVHGNSSNAGNFINQLTGDLGKKHHLIAFDFPGCGNSPFANDPQKTYSFEGLAQILSDIIASLSSPCWLVGHSLGANAALYATQKNSTHIKGYFLSGLLLVDKAEELAQAALPNPVMSFFYQENLSEPERKQLATAGFFNPENEAIASVSDGLKITDPLMRTGILTSISNPQFYAGHKQFLRSTQIPVALAEGEHDPFINRDYLEKQEIPSLWRKKVQMVENAGHYPYLENPDAINLLLDQFISK
jgi:pimeloyl-ACP methyl ester carboxylesterase